MKKIEPTIQYKANKFQNQVILKSPPLKTGRSTKGAKNTGTTTSDRPFRFFPEGKLRGEEGESMIL